MSNQRLIAISEAVHASAHGGNTHAKWLLREAKCDCATCVPNKTQPVPNRKHSLYLMHDKDGTALNPTQINVMQVLEPHMKSLAPNPALFIQIIGNDSRMVLNYDDYREPLSAQEDIENFAIRNNFYKIDTCGECPYYINTKNIVGILDPTLRDPDVVANTDWNLNIHFIGLNMTFRAADPDHVYKELVCRP